MSRTVWGKARSDLEATQWSRVMKAGQSPAREDLAALCRAYWQPVYRFVRARGFGRADAEDLTQGFFSSLLTPGALARFDPQRGRFRDWLRAALSHFLPDELEHQRARRRGGPGLVTFEGAATEEQAHELEPPGEPADQIFDRRWALAVTARALARVRADFEQAGEGALFAQLADHLAPTVDDPASDVAIGEATSARVVRHRALNRLRRRYRRYLREEIAQTVARPGDVDEEIMNLLEALG
jgi:RNA polymerase sigma factor (sigma-70 family)